MRHDVSANRDASIPAAKIGKILLLLIGLSVLGGCGTPDAGMDSDSEGVSLDAIAIRPVVTRITEGFDAFLAALRERTAALRDRVAALSEEMQLRERVDELLLEAERAREAGDLPGAAERLREVLALSPGDTGAEAARERLVLAVKAAVEERIREEMPEEAAAQLAVLERLTEGDGKGRGEGAALRERVAVLSEEMQLRERVDGLLLEAERAREAGDVSAAAERLREVLVLAPGNAEAEAALERLVLAAEAAVEERIREEMPVAAAEQLAVLERLTEEVAEEQGPAFEEPARQASKKPGGRFKDCDECPEMVMVPRGMYMDGFAVGGVGTIRQ